jgi:hypothetical protein
MKTSIYTLLKRIRKSVEEGILSEEMPLDLCEDLYVELEALQEKRTEMLNKL